MKQILIIGCTLLIILGLNFIQSSFLKDTSGILIAKITNLEDSITNQEVKEKTVSKAKELNEIWNKKELGFGIFCEHDSVEGIKESMSNIQRYISLLDEDNDTTLHLLIECNTLKERIEMVVGSEKLQLTNVL